MGQNRLGEVPTGAGGRLRAPALCSASDRLRKLALVPSELELLRSHPKDERGSVGEIGLCSMDGPNPAFLEAIPHGTVIIDYLT